VDEARERIGRWSTPDRVIHFLVVQTIKTIHNPARVIRIFLLYFRVFVSSKIRDFVSRKILPLIFVLTPHIELLVCHLSVAFPVLTSIRPERQLSPQRVLLHYHAGSDALQKSRPQAAWYHFERCLRGTTEPHHFFVAAIGLLQGLGRARDALSCFARANELNLQRAQKYDRDRTRYRILDNFWVGNIGHTATLDYVIKLGSQEGRSQDDTILYVAPGTHVANRCLLEQFRPHLRIIEHPIDLPIDEAAVSALRYDFVWPLTPDGSTVHFWEVAAKTYRRWYQSGRRALFTIPPRFEERGCRALGSKGLPEGAWFVALHVREPGSKRHHADLQQVLNANINSYLQAIDEITRRGGWVVRMGDPSMVPLPPLPKVIDYCHSNVRADWMDLFIAARCRFMVGTSSGPAYLPPLYGVPSVLTNWWPPAQRPWHPMDIFMPKMIRGTRDGRLLTLSETLAEPFSFCHCLSYLEKVKKVRVEDNSPELIRAAVVEMFERLEDKTPDDVGILSMRRRADDIYESHGAYGMGQLAAGFLQNYSSFIN
jgi:putative glycosyltransferase (TIGR04372 family)